MNRRDFSFCIVRVASFPVLRHRLSDLIRVSGLGRVAPPRQQPLASAGENWTRLSSPFP